MNAESLDAIKAEIADSDRVMNRLEQQLGVLRRALDAEGKKLAALRRRLESEDH